MAKMTKNAKILLGVGALAAIGVAVYASSKSAAASTSGGGTTPPAPAPPPGVTTFTFLPGHTYVLTMNVPPQAAATLPAAPALLTSVLTAIGNTSNAQFMQASPTSYVVSFDYSGPSETIPLPQPIAGASFQVTDKGQTSAKIPRSRYYLKST